MFKGKTNVKYLFILIIIFSFAAGVALFMGKIMECPYWWPAI